MSTTHQEPPTARRRETRTRLLDAATEVFAESGVQGASVEQVCARAGFTRGAFYSNFSTKEELFLAVLEREFDRRASEVEATIAELTPTLQQLRGLIDPDQAAEYITRFITPEKGQNHWFLLETEFSLLAMRDPEVAPGYVDLLTRATANFAALVETAITAAGRRFIFPADRTTEIIDGMCERAVRNTMAGGDDQSGGIDALPQQISALLFVVTEPIPSEDPETETENAATP